VQNLYCSIIQLLSCCTKEKSYDFLKNTKMESIHKGHGNYFMASSDSSDGMQFFVPLVLSLDFGDHLLLLLLLLLPIFILSLFVFSSSTPSTPLAKQRTNQQTIPTTPKTSCELNIQFPTSYKIPRYTLYSQRSNRSPFPTPNSVHTPPPHPNFRAVSFYITYTKFSKLLLSFSSRLSFLQGRCQFKYLVAQI